MEKSEKIISDAKLVVQSDLEGQEAFASVTLNPTLRWMKFILTDDEPNGNKQRIPETEFENLIKSGIHMPIKMARGEIKPGHDESLPIGVITDLVKVQNRIEGLAALWSRERPEDVEFVISEFKSGRAPQISWEIPYSISEVVEHEDGVQDLTNIHLRAATLVGLPAYAGRTPVLAVASKDDPSSMEDNIKMEELETLKSQLADAQGKVTELEGQISEKETALAEKETELAELRDYKAAVEKDKADEDRLASIKTKFADAKIEKEDEYFASNRDMLLGLDENSLNFMVQELVAFAEKTAEASASREDGVPNLINLDVSNPKNIKDLAAELRRQRLQK
jgi:hypothetical protein